MPKAEQRERTENRPAQPSLAARAERRRVERRLQEAGILCQPEVSLQYQAMAKRSVLRGVESGGATKEIGRYVTFCDGQGEPIGWLQPIDSVAVNGRHAVVIATALVSVEVFRVLGMEQGKVRFRWRDSQDHNQIKEMSLDAVEFIRRFLLHVLPSGFVKIRHFGFLSNRNRRAMVERCRQLLPPWTPPETTEPSEPLCPACRIGHLHVVDPRATERPRPTAVLCPSPQLDSS